MKNSPYLTGRILVSMPNNNQEDMSRTVVYICGHDDNGAIGLILNRVIPSLYVADLFDQLNVPISVEGLNKTPVYHGGSVELGRGFVLHSPDYHHDETIMIDRHTSLTASMDILYAIGQGKGPKEKFIALGYTNWKKGYLEEEIKNNQWLCFDDDYPDIFQYKKEEIWQTCINKISNGGHIYAGPGHC